MTFFQKPSEAAPTIILIPGITISLRTLPYILISIAIVVLSHEISHGISAKREGIGLKSVGLLLFLVIPGAFVEPEEEDLKKVPLKSRLRVYGAGSLSNMIVAALTLLLFLNFTFLISPLYVPQSQGVLIMDVVKGGPSEGILFPGAVIFEINGTRINNLEEFSEYLSKIIPGQILVLKTNHGDSIITTGAHPSNKQVAYLGVYPFNYYPPREYFQWMGPFIPYHVYWTFYWTWFVCLNIALFNLLPLFPLDGDKMFMEAAGYLTKDKDLKRLLTNFMRSLSLFLLLGNFALTFLNMGFITI